MARIKRRKQFFLIALAVAAVSVVAWQSGAAAHVVQSSKAGQPGLYRINHFIDGDTISVDINGKPQSVRLIGVDTPETHKPNTPVQCYGELAAAYTKQLIGSARVQLVADSQSDDRDVYGRLVRYVYLADGRNLDELLIQNGYGFAYLYFPFSKAAQFAADQQHARENHAGLWTACKPFQEANGRWQTEAAPP